VPSEAYLKRLFGKGAEHLAVLVGGALEESGLRRVACLEFEEALPHIGRGLAQVGEMKALVRWAPNGASGVVQVTAGEQFELAAAEHEVERKQGCTAEVVVLEARKDVEICRMKPELASGGLGTGTVPAGNKLAY
jgi:hypothetical protein